MSFQFNFGEEDGNALPSTTAALPLEWNKRQRVSDAQRPSLTSAEWWARAASDSVALAGRQHLLQYAWHFDMINDLPRNSAFHRAIADAIKQQLQQTQSARVLDIGTGSGLLALLAAQNGATGVTAFEAEADVARTAKLNAVRNGLESLVHIVSERSTSRRVVASAVPAPRSAAPMQVNPHVHPAARCV